MIKEESPDTAKMGCLDCDESSSSDLGRPPNKKQKTVFDDGLDVSMLDVSQLEEETSDDHPNAESLSSERSDYESDLDYARYLEEGIFEYSSTPSSPESAKPVVPYVTRKPLVKEPPYSGVIHGLFFFKKNVWIKSSQRTTALKMWDARED